MYFYGAALLGGLLFLIQSWRTHLDSGPSEPLPEIPAEGGMRTAGVGMFGGSEGTLGGRSTEGRSEPSDIETRPEFEASIPQDDGTPSAEPRELEGSSPDSPSWEGVEATPGQDPLSQALIERLEALEKLRPQRTEIDLNALAAAWRPKPGTGAEGVDGTLGSEGEGGVETVQDPRVESNPGELEPTGPRTPQQPLAPEPTPAWRTFLAESTLHGVIVGPESSRALVGDRLLEPGDTLFGGSLGVVTIGPRSVEFISEDGPVLLELPPFRVRPRSRSDGRSVGEEETPGENDDPEESSEDSDEGPPGEPGDGDDMGAPGGDAPSATSNELAPLLESLGNDQ